MLPELGQVPPGQRRGRRSERLTARVLFSNPGPIRIGCRRARGEPPRREISASLNG